LLPWALAGVVHWKVGVGKGIGREGRVTSGNFHKPARNSTKMNRSPIEDWEKRRGLQNRWAGTLPIRERKSVTKKFQHGGLVNSRGDSKQVILGGFWEKKTERITAELVR